MKTSSGIEIDRLSLGITNLSVLSDSGVKQVLIQPTKMLVAIFDDSYGFHYEISSECVLDVQIATGYGKKRKSEFRPTKCKDLSVNKITVVRDTFLKTILLKNFRLETKTIPWTTSNIPFFEGNLFIRYK